MPALDNTVADELDRLMSGFFRAVSFEPGERPPYDIIAALFIDHGLLIKNTGDAHEVSTVEDFIRPRQAMVEAGHLTRFEEHEIFQVTELFGNVAHRFSAYGKTGTMKGQPFEARGMISTQYVRTPHGWRMSSMAWDDERPGLAIPDGPAR